MQGTFKHNNLLETANVNVTGIGSTRKQYLFRTCTTIGCSTNTTNAATTLPDAPESVAVRVVDEGTLQVTIEPPLNDGGAAITRYEVASRTLYPGQELGEVHIATVGADGWEHFVIGDEHFLVVANRDNGGNYDIDSVVYKYDATRSSNPFQSIQTIPTHCARGWEHFMIGDQHFLVVANQMSGNDVTSDFDINSVVYLYDSARSSNPFQSFQTIPTKGAQSWEHFVIGDDNFLVVANYYDGSKYDIDTVVYKYDATRSSNPFQSIQTIPTQGARGWEHFMIGDRQ